jgi:hypothetical protein
MVPTAEEFLHSYKKRIGVRLISDMSPKQVSEYAIEFAKLHAEQALKAVSKRTTYGMLVVPLFNEEQIKSILNAYPPENIK